MCESERIGLGFVRVAAYNTARGRAWMFGRGCVQQGGESVAAEGEESVAAAEGRNAREESVAAGGVRGGWANAEGLGFHAAPG